MAEANQSKNNRREAAREKARIERMQAQKKAKSKKLITQIGIVSLVAGVIAGIIAIVVASSIPLSNANPRNMASDGILFDGSITTNVATKAIPESGNITASKPSEEKVNIVVYVDYLCPYCNQFETANSGYLEELVNTGKATVEYHPIAILSEYSRRAAAAAACVADLSPQNFWEYNSLLYENQPAETAAGGLKNSKLIQLAEQAGADNVSDCINSKEFYNWSIKATDRASEGPLPNTEVTSVAGTPTVLVDGIQYPGNPSDYVGFEQFVTEAITAKQGG